LVALAFRGGPQVAKLFPKLTARWRGLPKEKQNEIIEDVAKKERTSAEIVKERLEWLQENDARIAQKNATQARSNGRSGNSQEGAPNGKEQPIALEYKPFPEKLPDQARFTVSVQPNEAFKFPEAGRD
jgi:hypothetical protein